MFNEALKKLVYFPKWLEDLQWLNPHMHAVKRLLKQNSID